MAAVYILHSKSIDTFYIGSCLDFELRFKDHLEQKYADSFTKRANDWSLFFKIDDLNYSQARNIEGHIKRMKSKLYIKNLLIYPDI